MIKLKKILRGMLLPPFIVFIVCFSLSAQKEILLKISDCETDDSLIECLIYSKSGEFLGLTNKSGECKILLKGNEKKKIVYIQKYGFRTIIDTLYPDENNICMEKLSVSLDEVEIKSDFNVKDYLLELIKNTKENSLKKNDTVFYQFEYRLEVPDSNWSDRLSGILVIPFRSIDKKYWQLVYYTQYEHEINSHFKESELYEKCPENRITQEINYIAEILYKRRKIEKEIKRKRSVCLIDKNANTDSTISFQIIKNIKDYKIKKNFIFNRKDSFLLSVKTYYLPESGYFKILNNRLKESYSEVFFSTTYPISIESMYFTQIYDNNGTTIDINFYMNKINDEETIKINKNLPFLKVMILSNVKGIEAIKRGIGILKSTKTNKNKPDANSR